MYNTTAARHHQLAVEEDFIQYLSLLMRVCHTAHLLANTSMIFEQPPSRK